MKPVSGNAVPAGLASELLTWAVHGLYSCVMAPVMSRAVAAGSALLGRVPALTHTGVDREVVACIVDTYHA